MLYFVKMRQLCPETCFETTKCLFVFHNVTLYQSLHYHFSNIYILFCYINYKSIYDCFFLSKDIYIYIFTVGIY